NQNPIGGIAIADVAPSALYWIILRSFVFIALTVYILGQLSQVLSAIHSLQTFYHKSIRSFRKAGIAALILAVLGCFNLDFILDPVKIHLGIPFGMILLAVGFRVLEAVFAEGKSLQEDINHII
ncbi:MAG: DUF2975 domain-containing protein, partial [Bacteroidota bacterium]